jgi:hypothetical protein
MNYIIFFYFIFFIEFGFVFNLLINKQINETSEAIEKKKYNKEIELLKK